MLIEPWWPRSVQPQATLGRPHEKFTGVTLIWNFLVTWFELSVVLNLDLGVLDRRHCFIKFVLTLIKISLGQGHACWHLLVSSFNPLLVFTSIHVFHLFCHFAVFAFMMGGKGLCQDGVRRYLSLIVKLMTQNKSWHVDIYLARWFSKNSIFFWLRTFKKDP